MLLQCHTTVVDHQKEDEYSFNRKRFLDYRRKALIHNLFYKYLIKWQDTEVQNRKLREDFKDPIFGPDKALENKSYPVQDNTVLTKETR
jgi:hypothetical protein